MRLSIYVPEEMRRELDEEGGRSDRSTSWLLRTAWKLAKEKIKMLPAYGSTKEQVER